MTQKELFALMEHFERGGCASLKYSTKDVTVELAKPSAAAPAAQPVPAAAPAAQPVPAAADAPGGAAPAEDGLFVTAPLVGTYYAAPAPGEAPFVQVGDRVEKGKPVCLLEAMKMMNEVPAPCDLVVEELLRQDGELVAFDDPILRYRAV